jgi:hypothetical protein
MANGELRKINADEQALKRSVNRAIRDLQEVADTKTINGGLMAPDFRLTATQIEVAMIVRIDEETQRWRDAAKAGLPWPHLDRPWKKGPS